MKATYWPNYLSNPQMNTHNICLVFTHSCCSSLPPSLPGVSARHSYLTSKNMAMADLWLVLITNQTACVVQGTWPPSSPKSHFLFIVLSLSLSVFFIACWQWFYLVPADSIVSSSVGNTETDSLRIWKDQNQVYLQLHQASEQSRTMKLYVWKIKLWL